MLTGLILAGGNSTRMGIDKGMMLFKDLPMIQHAINTLKPITKEIIICTNYQRYRKLGYKLVADEVKNMGPLAGLISGLKDASTQNVAVLSCDVPLVTTSIITRLYQHLNRFDAIVANTKNQVHPLVSIYKKTCIETFEKQLLNDELSLRKAIKSVNFSELIFDQNIEQFSNINTVEELEKYDN